MSFSPRTYARYLLNLLSIQNEIFTWGYNFPWSKNLNATSRRRFHPRISITPIVSTINMAQGSGGRAERARCAPQGRSVVVNATGAGAASRSAPQSSAEAETRGFGLVVTQHGDVAYGITKATQVCGFCARQLRGAAASRALVVARRRSGGCKATE